MTDTLKGKAAVVTGAGRGIGRGIALLLAAEGAKVVVNDLGGEVDGSGASQSPADEVVAEIKKNGGEAVACYDSVATMEGGEGIIQTCVDNFGKVDILVCVAGILRDRMVFNMTEQEWGRRYSRPPEGDLYVHKARIHSDETAERRTHCLL